MGAEILDPVWRKQAHEEQEDRHFAHVRERMKDRYGWELTREGFVALNAASNSTPLRLNHQARIPGTELRFFYYEGMAILGFYRVDLKRMTSVLPFEDLRWRLVPLEHRPRQALAKTMQFGDRNWLPGHARTGTTAPPKPFAVGDLADLGRLEQLEEAVAWAFAHNILAHLTGPGFDENLHSLLRRVILER